MKITLSPNFTGMVTAHGKTKAYLHRFKIIQSPEYVCTHGDRTTDNLIFDCDILDKERGKLIAHTSREEDWPVRKCDLVNPYPTAFPYGNGMVLHFYQQQESSTTKTVHKVINKGLKAYV